MSWWAVGPAGATSAAGTQQAPDRATAEKDAQAYGETVLAGPFSSQAQAQAWTAGTAGGGGTSSGGSWWVVKAVIAARGGQQLYNAVQAASRPPDTAVTQTVAGPFPTRAAAEADINKLENPAHLPNPLTGVAAIGDFVAKLGQANTWIRVAEVLLGLGLIIVGLAKLASGTAAGKAAIKAGKAAALL